MVFGLGALEATRWLVRPAPDGLFFSLEVRIPVSSCDGTLLTCSH